MDMRKDSTINRAIHFHDRYEKPKVTRGSTNLEIPQIEDANKTATQPSNEQSNERRNKFLDAGERHAGRSNSIYLGPQTNDKR